VPTTTNPVLVELADTFSKLYQETFKTRRKTRTKTGKLRMIPMWQKVADFLAERQVTPVAYFTVLFRYLTEKGKAGAKSYGINWYGSAQAFEIFDWYGQRLTSNHGVWALASEAAIVKQAVENGVRLLLQAAKIHKCGIQTRQVLINQLSTTFFAVDDYWPYVADCASDALRTAVEAERQRLARNPSLLSAAKEAYNGWQSLVTN